MNPDCVISVTKDTVPGSIPGLKCQPKNITFCNHVQQPKVGKQSIRAWTPETSLSLLDYRSKMVQ